MRLKEVEIREKESKIRINEDSAAADMELKELKKQALREKMARSHLAEEQAALARPHLVEEQKPAAPSS